MAIDPIPFVRIPTLTQRQPFVDKDGRLTNEALRTLNGALGQLARAFNELAAIPEIRELVEAAQAAAEAAQAAADTAQDAADGAGTDATAARKEQSLVSSYPANFTSPLIDADSAGNITIANHDRVYGEPALDPTVAVTGDVINFGLPGDVVRIFYDDPARTGGVVVYQATFDPYVAVQGNDRHSVGAVGIPAAGNQPGREVYPPGYAQP